LIAHAKIKTDRIDASVLARLYASGFLPEVWAPDERTQALRRQVTRRNQLVRQRTRLKNIVQSILHSHLIPPCPTGDLFGPKGRAWLLAQVLPSDERFAVERHMREYDRLGEDLGAVERDLARDGGDRSNRALRQPAAPGQLLRSESERPSVGKWSSPSRPDHQTRTGACPRHVGRGRLGGRSCAGSAARLLSADPRPPWSARGGSRRCPQAHRTDLAHAAKQ
jgi:hypothetical protein